MKNCFGCVLFLLASIPCVAQTSNVEVIELVDNPEVWSNPPAGFRDVPFGATREKAEEVLGKMKCRRVGQSTSPEYESCTTTDRSKAFRANDVVVATYYQFYEGMFVGVTFSETVSMSVGDVAPDLYSTLSAAFTAKFGNPTEARTIRNWGTREVKINRTVGGRSAGTRIDFAPYDYKTHSVVWQNDYVYIFLVEGTPGRLSNGSFGTKEWEAVKKKTREESKENAGKNVTPF